ncbi:MAG: putative Zn-dependent protease [Pseudohongiellaceae bacterium]
MAQQYAVYYEIVGFNFRRSGLMTNKKFISCLVLLLNCVLLVSCAVNPVTGRNEISLVSEVQERAIGEQQYGPSQQSQGGEFAVDETLSQYVNEVGQRIAAVSDRPLDYEFVVLNNSVPNAWALPGGKIAVNRGLLTELNNEAELAAVLGHEVVHAAARHGAQAMTRGTLLQGALAVGSIALQDNDYGDYIVGASQLGAQLITTRYGREAERESDYYGIQYMLRAGYDPRAAVSLQETFVRLSEGRNPGWIEGLFASHPPSEERVANNQALVAELMPQWQGRDLELGELRYQQALGFLQENADAYALFDEAQAAIADGDLDIALLNLDAASEMVPQEARFTGLKGDILLNQKNYRDAINAYDRSIGNDANYYDYYLGRGVAYARLGERNLARADLEHSSALLPTAVAMNELGKVALFDNDRQLAKQYFSEAAQGQGRVGQEAGQSFARLDVEDNPGNYIVVRPYVDDDGRIFGRVFNNSDIDLSDISLNFAAVLGDRVGTQTRTISSLTANSFTDINSGMRFPDGQVWTNEQMEVEVRRARAL